MLWAGDRGDLTVDENSDLQDMVEHAEAGIADVLAAYDQAEEHYIVAVANTPATAVVTYGWNTSA
jgi:hypothetical protein